MNAEVGRSSPPPAIVRRHRVDHVTELRGYLAVPVLLAGVLSLTDHSWLSRLLGWSLPAHTLFALLLCGWVATEWYSCAHKSHAAAADERDCIRHLTRRIYLMLYLIIGIGQLIGLIGMHYGGTFHHPDLSFLATALVALTLARVPGSILSRYGQ